MKALLIVDLQNDFCPGGKLAVPEGGKVVPIINQLLDKFPLVLASQDWHPVKTVHFDKWPVHCVRESEGAKLHPDLKRKKITKVFLKGTDNKDDGYSVFEATNDDLEGFLRGNNVEELYLTGLATEYCVKATAIDAVEKGFKVFVIREGVAGIKEEDVEKAVKEMESKGINYINYSSI
ncbi:nicotinamidase [Halocella sp. SP3-1]|uniref:nicotinamidase n=1 Tax=Halocella sp. SP3-1 TaxID=2382161 RepID=UPI000F74E709|nr:nicotinamidase [Halocella sp. SP3-1]AZO93740.1 nicotinamidase [Halocella sp. SP3-1]